MTGFAVDAIGEAIAGVGPAWFPGLAPSLTDEDWNALAAVGLGPGEYSTDRLLGGAGDAKLLEVRVGPDIDGRKRRISVEWPSAPILSRYEPRGLRFLDRVEADWIMSALRTGIAALDQVPSLAATVAGVVGSIHPLRSDDPDTDVSYSDPDVPFSIFVGVQRQSGAVHDLRLAEGVVHEAMHLQLTMIERRTPLIARADATAYSPWRAERRPLQGVLHGAYVFRCLADFYEMIGETRGDHDEVAGFCAARRRTICEEIAEALADQIDDPGFTPAGAALAKRLLTSAPSATAVGKAD